MSGTIPPLLLYAFMAWCSVKKAQGLLYLYFIMMKLKWGALGSWDHGKVSGKIFLGKTQNGCCFLSKNMAGSCERGGRTERVAGRTHTTVCCGCCCCCCCCCRRRRRRRRRNEYSLKLKVNLSLWFFKLSTTPWRLYGGAEVWLHAFLTSALDGGEWSASRPYRFTPRKRALWYSLNRRLGGPQNRFGRGAETNTWI
jgi:hypothetical protein